MVLFLVVGIGINRVFRIWEDLGLEVGNLSVDGIEEREYVFISFSVMSTYIQSITLSARFTI